MNDRILQVRQHPKINLSQEAFGKRLGLTGSGISLIESGRRNASEQVILSICREFSVNERWLRTGEGEMFVETAEDSLRAVVREYGLGESDYHMLAEFVELSSSERKAVIGYMRRVVDRVNRMEGRSLPKVPQEMTNAEVLAEVKRQLDDEEKAGATTAVSGLKQSETA